MSEEKGKAFIFGAGGTGRRVAEVLSGKYDICGFIDNDETKWDTYIDGVKIYGPDTLLVAEYDVVLLGTLMGYIELQEQMLEMGVPAYKIRDDYVGQSVNSRIDFLKRYAENVYREDMGGAVGEAGVFRGEFAKEINRCFPDRKCYLFDTFDGFAEKDIQCEQEESLIIANYMKGLSEQLVYEKMTHKENIIISKGFFPDTAIELKITDQFCFVNLDMDLFKPIYEGLCFFYPKMVIGGCILIHDYYSAAYPNVKKAVERYEVENHMKLAKLPIGDDISIAVIKI